MPPESLRWSLVAHAEHRLWWKATAVISPGQDVGVRLGDLTPRSLNPVLGDVARGPRWD